MIVVTTPANSNNLVAIADARAACGVMGSAEDAVIGAMIDRASDVIARHCKRSFALETISETIRLRLHQDEILLSRYPVVDVVSIGEDADELTTLDYEIDKSTGVLSRLYKGSSCWWPRSKTVVVYSAGYTLANMPGALRQACLQLVKAYYIGADRDPLIRSEGLDAISSASYFGGDDTHLPPDVVGLLKPFRKIK